MDKLNADILDRLSASRLFEHALFIAAEEVCMSEDVNADEKVNCVVSKVGQWLNAATLELVGDVMSDYVDKK